MADLRPLLRHLYSAAVIAAFTPPTLLMLLLIRLAERELR